MAQYAKGAIHDLPLVYAAVTDPVAAQLLHQADRSDENMTGSADRQDLAAMLSFVKTLLPQAKTVGLLYASGESNDKALVSMMNEAAAAHGLQVQAVAVDQARDVPLHMSAFKGQADFIYVGTSGPIQPTLPVISAEAKKMGIPLINAEEDAVKTGLALGSFGVNYLGVGKNTATLVGALLKGGEIKDLHPLYPVPMDHHGFINKTRAAENQILIPSDLSQLTIVE
jgi:putative ABC transport system substrate-binding protein